MRIVGRYILTKNEYKILLKCKKIKQIEKHDIMKNGRKICDGYEYTIIADIYKRKEKHTEEKDKEINLYFDYKRLPYDWRFLTKEEFLVELL
jgi:hypothetical protein